MGGFPSFFNDGFPTSDTTLKTDIKETDKDYEVHVDMPAFDKKDIDIDYKDNILTIGGRRDSIDDHNDKNGDMIMSERSSGRFMRQYSLPNVDSDKIKATYDKGVLTVELPKLSRPESSKHHIEID
jgi:Molecular chaperone (small heat shock protein)